MKTYQKNKFGEYVEGSTTYPAHFKNKIDKEVISGDAEVLDYIALPLKTPSEILEEVYEQAMKNQKLLKALILAINDGSIVPGKNVSPSALKTAIKAKM